MGNVGLQNNLKSELQQNTIEINKARKYWQNAKSTAKSAKDLRFKDLLKAFKRTFRITGFEFRRISAGLSG
jgi:hypothetical protein